MTLKPMGHICPVCKKDVYGYRITRRYCSDSCKARHHLDARKQIKVRLQIAILDQEINNVFLQTRENEHFDERYLNLISRDLYLLEGLLGPNFNSAMVNIRSMKNYKFQFGEAFAVSMLGNSKVYRICNYEYRKEGDILHINRVGSSPEYCVGYYERWLLDFPEKEGYEIEGEVGLRELILENGGIWRE